MLMCTVMCTVSKANCKVLGSLMHDSLKLIWMSVRICAHSRQESSALAQFFLACCFVKSQFEIIFFLNLSNAFGLGLPLYAAKKVFWLSSFSEKYSLEMKVKLGKVIDLIYPLRTCSDAHSEWLRYPDHQCSISYLQW